MAIIASVNVQQKIRNSHKRSRVFCVAITFHTSRYLHLFCRRRFRHMQTIMLQMMMTMSSIAITAAIKYKYIIGFLSSRCHHVSWPARGKRGRKEKIVFE